MRIAIFRYKTHRPVMCTRWSYFGCRIHALTRTHPYTHAHSKTLTVSHRLKKMNMHNHFYTFCIAICVSLLIYVTVHTFEWIRLFSVFSKVTVQVFFFFFLSLFHFWLEMKLCVLIVVSDLA